jgi:hypothetical protein
VFEHIADTGKTTGSSKASHQMDDEFFSRTCRFRDFVKTDSVRASDFHAESVSIVLSAARVTVLEATTIRLD